MFAVCSMWARRLWDEVPFEMKRIFERLGYVYCAGARMAKGRSADMDVKWREDWDMIERFCIARR